MGSHSVGIWIAGVEAHVRINEPVGPNGRLKHRQKGTVLYCASPIGHLLKFDDWDVYLVISSARAVCRPSEAPPLNLALKYRLVYRKVPHFSWMG